ncbi:MAG: ComF family protein, partial [Clostridia bacterium]|nr:ComF family protein [Clostridia bacterium]
LCCKRALGGDDPDGLCPDCSRELLRLAARQEKREMEESLPLPDGIDELHAAFVYEGPARKLVHRLKYESVRAAAVPLARQMAYLPSGEEEIIVPVPTDPKRERKRGFNQASVLAQHMAKELGMEMKTALVRVEARRPQTGLSADERRRNLTGCMEVCDAVNGKRVLLVDDVVTTGATVSEAARALCQAGAKSICVFAAARAAGDPAEQKDPFELP